ncbi:MAG TPA: UDP-N-acetylmuramoyl-L-alanine--D-glutamate ligase [Candidatus Limnocylindria bacterium]|nr:UDP-N-acetylmuramoyl-L-alanine--D-glutamate ligase [Candidatus Limnocylindria bacterium]
MSLLFDAEVDREDFRGRRVTIVGLGKGRTASGLARFLVSCGARVTITDALPRERLGEGIARLADTPVELVLGPSSDDAALADPDFVFVVSGVRPRSATILRALGRHIPVLTEMGLFFRLCPATIVGVTGTKGKTTTTTMIGGILSHGARRVIVGGNIGRAVIQELDTMTKGDIVLLELSSFQLETLARSPHVAVVTNIGEDHLDHHGTRENYIAAKRNIVAWQGANDVAVLNLDDPTTMAVQTGASSIVRGFSLSMRPRHGGYLDPDGRLVLTHGERRTPICAAAELRVPGRHNVANALAAAIVGEVFDIPPEVIGEELRAFEGVSRRLETVAEKDGVLWVNDSASTTPDATIKALQAFDRPALVILGGVGKGADFSELARVLVKRARGAVLIGAAADEIASVLDTAGAARADVAVERARTLEEAVAAARRLARSGDVVLLSPACASFDMFTSADERGDRFTALVRSFTEPVRS